VVPTPLGRENLQAPARQAQRELGVGSCVRESRRLDLSGGGGLRARDDPRLAQLDARGEGGLAQDVGVV